MIRYLLLIVCSSFFGVVAAQDLWISGSAVPGGVQKLEKVSETDYKYAGQLTVGELCVMTSKKVSKDTRYLKPLLPDANIVNHGLDWQETTDAAEAAWQVVVDDQHYRFHVYTDQKLLRGEIFQPWGELFIGGGATEVGWQKAEGHMLLMQQDLQNPYVWTWEGELRRHSQFEEPASFKFQGQDRWSPKSLHPYSQDTDILTDNRLRTGGSDTKWTLSRDGRYRITIDLFKETVQAETVKD